MTTVLYQYFRSAAVVAIVYLCSAHAGAITIINTAAGSESTATAAMAQRALGLTPSAALTTETLTQEAKAAAPKGPIAPPNENVPGKRAKVGAGVLYVPDFYQPEADGGVTLVVWFLGASWCVEQGFHHANRNAVLVSVTVPNYGYPQFLKDPRNMQEIVYGTQGYLQRENIVPEGTKVRRIVLGSFSGGWTGVQGMLNDPTWSPMVTDVLLADSFYPRRAGKTEIDPEMAQPLVDFATRAANASTSAPAMAFTYLFPPLEEHRSNTTNRAAEYLAKQVGVTWQPTNGKSTRGMKYGRRADAGNLHIIGVEGMTTQDHFEHLYSWEDLMRLSSVPAATTGGKK